MLLTFSVCIKKQEIQSGKKSLCTVYQHFRTPVTHEIYCEGFGELFLFLFLFKAHLDRLCLCMPSQWQEKWAFSSSSHSMKGEEQQQMLSKQNCGKKEKATFWGQGLMLIELLVQATKKTRISAADKGTH